MSWIIPENKLGPDVRLILDYHLNEGENLCISGFVKSGKTTALLHFYRHIYIQQPSAKILFLVYSNSIVELLKQTVSQQLYTFSANSSSA